MNRSIAAIRSKRAGRAGFSMMELLVAVTIIGIVAAVIVPRLSVSTSTTRGTVQSHHLKQLNKLVNQHYIDVGTWPTTTGDLATAYLPDGWPTPPQGGTYTLNTSTNRVEHSP